MNAKSHHVSTIITEEINIDDSINLTKHALSPIIDIIRIYCNKHLNEFINKNFLDLDSLLKDLATKSLTDNDNSENNHNLPAAPTNRCRNNSENNTTNAKNNYVSTSILSNLLEINNHSSSSSLSTSNYPIDPDDSKNLFYNIENIKESVKSTTINVFVHVTNAFQSAKEAEGVAMA